MTALAKSENKTVLLLLPSRREMYPLSTAALTRAQNSRRRLVSDYRDALILDREGLLRQIERIDVIGPWGYSPARRFLSRLTDAWSIKVHLSEPLPHSLDRIKQILLDCMVSPQSVDTMQLDEEARVKILDSVRTAPSATELLDILKLPLPNDALDVL